MRNRKMWRNRFLGAAAMGVAALTVSLATSGTAFAGVTIPPYPTVGAYPTWYTANNSASNDIRAAGSDTTFPVMQQLADEYNQSGLYGCTLLAPAQAFCNSTGGTGAPNYSDVTTTDTNDNFDSTEVLMGLNSIGSGNGQKQLCGTMSSPQPVDFSRSSKPIAAISGCPMVEAGYAKDAVPVTDVQGIDPHAFITGADPGTGYIGHTFSGPNQTFTSPAFPSGSIGPVAAGWLPAPYGHANGAAGGAPGVGTTGNDPYGCKPAGSGAPLSNTCTGTPFSDVDNTGGVNSIAYRIWCESGANRITDWGQLTNLVGGVAVGQGTPIGVPIRVIAVNQGSGTVATFNSFAYSQAGTSGTTVGCYQTANYNINGASGQNPLVGDTDATTNPEIALENNASSIGQFAAANWPNDPADQAVDIATSLYYQSYGYYNAIPNSGTIQIDPGTATLPAGVPGAYVVTLTNENNTAGGVSIANERANNYPTARTLFNIWRQDTVRASTGGFLNWICDTNPVFTGGVQTSGGSNSKEQDNLYGPNYDTDVTQTIQQFGFSRITDTTPELNVAKITPADNLVTPNGTCSANLPIVSTGTNVLTLNEGSPDIYGTTIPPVIGSSPAWTATWPANSTTGTAAGSAKVTSVSGATITLAAAVPSTVTTIYFPGHPPVLAVANPNT